ncbi:PadR family transcriptional regulator [Microbacterium sp. No. 7]|uniref:PadR family transcriptional regulator n=1 Tax=Microbacterium sp. No. 7 TaxID=1714373 RepID=UPI0006D1FE35|nr:PadR family transcriptional regulator [Microbacterium sp. No. 7]ALJ21738.1 hypothetical protein AOA12_18305 [Microbacterium sp. No. 7]
MQFLILGLLLHGPLSAYELRKRFTAGISLFYAASLGGIQRALGVLEAQGRVTKEASAGPGRPKHLYAVTESGRAAWHDWMLSPITESDAEQIGLAKVYLLGSMPPEDRAEVVSLLRRRTAADLERLTALRAEIDATPIPERSRDVARFRRATLDYGIRAHELMVRWLDELESA